MNDVDGTLGSASRAGAPRSIFVSYRRRDSQGTTGRLTDVLEHRFGKPAVFRDVGAIRPGMNFVSEIEVALQSALVVLAVIGPEWLARIQSFGNSPTDGPTDYLRFELKTALTRGILVIPVLVDGASMPAQVDLPAELAGLSSLQAHELTDKNWEYDVGRLIEVVGPRVQPPPVSQTVKAPVDPWLVGVTLTAVFAIALVGILYSGPPGRGVDQLVPALVAEVFSEHAADGGTALLGGGLLLGLLKLLLAQYKDALGQLVGQWLGGSHVFGVVTVGLILVGLMLAAHRPMLATGIALAFAGYLGTRQWLPTLFLSRRRSRLAAAGAVALLAGTLAADVAIDRKRQADFDVAFLLPPEGDVKHAREVFTEMSAALLDALGGTAKVEIAPAHVSDKDLENYSFPRDETLLNRSGRKGPARLFIRVQYTVDPSLGVKRLVVTPYLRPTAGVGPVERLPDWKQQALSGPEGSHLLALQLTFELVSYLSKKEVLRLNESELQHGWRNLLTEYSDALKLQGERCATAVKTVDEVARGEGNLSEDALARALFANCEPSPPPATAASPNRAVATALAPYAALGAR